MTILARWGCGKTKPICRPSAGNPKREALNPKQKPQEPNDRPEATLERIHLKKQSQFAGCPNERNIFSNKGLRQFFGFETAEKRKPKQTQSQNRGPVPQIHCLGQSPSWRLPDSCSWRITSNTNENKSVSKAASR
jgi:hypothetical protein